MIDFIDPEPAKNNLATQYIVWNLLPDFVKKIIITILLLPFYIFTFICILGTFGLLLLRLFGSK